MVLALVVAVVVGDGARHLSLKLNFEVLLNSSCCDHLGYCKCDHDVEDEKSSIASLYHRLQWPSILKIYEKHHCLNSSTDRDH